MSSVLALFMLMGVVNVCSLDVYLKPIDSYQIIQDAFDLAKNKSYVTIYLGSGVYTISRNVEMYANTALIGEGMNKTIIKLVDYAKPFRNGASWKAGIIRATIQKQWGCDNILIANLTLDGNKQNQYNDSDHTYGRFGLFTEVCKNLTFDTVEVHSMQGYGFDPHGIKPNDYAYGLIVKNCISHHNDWDGFTIDQTVNTEMSNCTAYDNGRHGFNIVTGSRHTAITNSTSFNNGFYYYTQDAGCGLAFQANRGYPTKSIIVSNSTFIGDLKGGFCTTGNVSDITLNNLQITTLDRCIHLAATAVNVSIWNINCMNAKMFVRNFNAVNLIMFNNTLNGTSMPPFPKPAPAPSPKTPAPSG